MYRRLIQKSMTSLSSYSSSATRSASSSWPNNARLLSSLHKQPTFVDEDSTSSADATQKASLLTTTIRPWNTPVVESHGDYRAEAFLEDHIGGPLYQHQRELPLLPVPTIQETLDRFLPTALPLAKNDSEEQSLLDACAAFPQQASLLQERLLHRREQEPNSSWLQHWWNTAGYLQVRDPVVINVSYFFHFTDDPTLPFGMSGRNICRGAAILTALAQYRRQVVTGQLPADAVGKKNKKTFLCSTAYKYMMNACRIPHRVENSYVMYDPSRHAHCIVARRGHFFAVDFVDPSTGLPLPMRVLEERLRQCVERADDAPPPIELGWLTSQDRDSWADAREELLRVGGAQMQDALETLQSGAFLLCLDDEEPVSRKQCAELFLHSNVSSGHNRWFDKSIEIICTNNGKAGLLGEHSMMDGMPVVGLADHLTATTYAKAAQAETVAPADTSGGVRNIFQDLYPKLMASSSAPVLVEKAMDHLTQLVAAHEVDVQSFQAYGSNFIKQAGYSPDAYVQMAMQLATYRLFGEQAGTYEATQVRPFLHGRTETTRSVSPASEAFVKRMGLHPAFDEYDPVVRQEKLSLLQDAVASHIKYIGDAAKGQGVDRHFLGLSMLVKEGEETPTLYSDPVFIRSKRWRVSTSHLTHPKFENWGYGEVVPDGVGLAYAVKSDSCIFNIAARREHQWTDRLSHNLEQALLEMRSMIEADKPVKSRL